MILPDTVSCYCDSAVVIDVFLSQNIANTDLFWMKLFLLTETILHLEPCASKQGGTSIVVTIMDWQIWFKMSEKWVTSALALIYILQILKCAQITFKVKNKNYVSVMYSDKASQGSFKVVNQTTPGYGF